MSAATAILLVGHGTRDKRGIAEFLELADRLAARFPSVPVAPCFLELAEPTIEAAIARLVDCGAQQIVVAPVLLFAAGHAKRDIPEAVDRALRKAEKIAGIISWQQASVIESHPKLLELALERLRAALRDSPTTANDRPARAESIEDGATHAAWPDLRAPAGQPYDLCLVVVGRGSYDDEATAAMRRFAAILADNAGIRHFRVAFIAMAEPKYPCVLRELATQAFKNVVIQPHLLFEGELLAKLRTDVCETSREFPQINWRLAAHLGPDALLVDALEANCCDALTTLATATGTK